MKFSFLVVYNYNNDDDIVILLHTQVGVLLQVREICHLASYNQFIGQIANRIEVSVGKQCYTVVDSVPLYSQPLVKDAQIKLTGLVYHMISDGNLKFAQLLRNALVDKVTWNLMLSKIITYNLHTVVNQIQRMIQFNV